MLIPTNVQGILGRGSLLLQKHAPEILTGVGLLSMGTAAVMGARATIKLEATIDNAEVRIASVKQTKEYAISNPEEVELYSDKAYQRDLYKAYLNNVMDFTKLYGPAISLFIAGAGSVVAAHGIMRKRNVALIAAYNAVEKSFAAYRARVVEDLGPEKDRDYRLGITETSETDENGKKHAAVTIDPTKASRYARVFDESNDYWQKDAGYNQFFLTAEQNYLNDKLRVTGHVFLNDVYRRLGFKDTPEGSVVGWTVSKNGGDNYIDFGIYDLESQAKRNFINGYERSIWLDFNVDGVIYDKI